MIRAGIPGGVCSARQYLVMDELASKYGNGGLKLTTRQAYQLHGVLKWDLKQSIVEINRALMDTLAACGDVCRNVLGTPAPMVNAVADDVTAVAQAISKHLKPQTTAYKEIWLTELEDAGGVETKGGESKDDAPKAKKKKKKKILVSGN